MMSGRTRRTAYKALQLLVYAALVVIVWIDFLSRVLPSYRLHGSLPAQTVPTVFSADGHIRDCVTGQVIGRVPKDLPTRRLVIQDPTEASDSRLAAFKKIFDTREWGDGFDKARKGLSASGYGSTIDYTAEAVATLHTVIHELKRLLGVARIRMLDVPCGDMAWMSRFLETRDDIDYTGFDIVPDMIANHRQKFADKPWRFQHQDLVLANRSQLAEFDLIFSRMMLQHLTFADVIGALTRLSDARDVTDSVQNTPQYLLTTTISHHNDNEELDVKKKGRFRNLNLELPPVSFVPPLCLHYDGPDHFKHLLGLWPLPLRQVHCEKPIRIPSTGTISKPLYSCTNWTSV